MVVLNLLFYGVSDINAFQAETPPDRQVPAV
jgi:hypothetical protein